MNCLYILSSISCIIVVFDVFTALWYMLKSSFDSSWHAKMKWKKKLRLPQYIKMWKYWTQYRLCYSLIATCMRLRRCSVEHTKNHIDDAHGTLSHFNFKSQPQTFDTTLKSAVSLKPKHFGSGCATTPYVCVLKKEHWSVNFYLSQYKHTHP